MLFFIHIKKHPFKPEASSVHEDNLTNFVKLLFPLFLSSLAKYVYVLDENTIGFAVKGKINLCQMTFF